MTVKEVKEILNQFPEESDIIIWSGTDYCEITNIDKMKTLNTETGEEIIIPVLVF